MSWGTNILFVIVVRFLDRAAVKKAVAKCFVESTFYTPRYTDNADIRCWHERGATAWVCDAWRDCRGILSSQWSLHIKVFIAKSVLVSGEKIINILVSRSPFRSVQSAPKRILCLLRSRFTYARQTFLSRHARRNEWGFWLIAHRTEEM